MNENGLFKELTDSMVELDKDLVVSNTQKAIDSDLPSLEILEKGLLPGLNIIGEKFENEEMFLPELMKSATIFQEAMEKLRPVIKEKGEVSQKKGTVVIGTVKGDLHYIGKNIVKLLMETRGFEVFDLGVDVDPFSFVKKADEVGADIIALSALLTTTLVGQRDVIEALDNAGKREKYKIMVGGGAVTPEWAEEIKADAYSETAYDAIEKAGKFVS
jgi:corrinoid protein of di/trimethylamine methyltransferase